MQKPYRKDIGTDYRTTSWQKGYGYNMACDDWEEYHKEKMTNLLSITKDLLTWCIEPDKKLITKQYIERIYKQLEDK